MRRFRTRGVFPIIALLFAASCSSPYLKNRGRDFADILTIEAQTRSYGAALRIGPLQAGLNYKSPEGGAYGLRGGHVGSHHTASFTALLFGSDYFSSSELTDLLRGGIPEERGGRAATLPSDDESEEESFSAEGDNMLELRRKEYRARAPFGTSIPLQKKRRLFRGTEGFVTAPYYTQIDATVGLFGGIHIGFNIGELLDFVLGLLTVDIYGDDEPFPDPRIERLKKDPLWKLLGPEKRREAIEKLKGL
jgi:hypothetical protein